MTYAIIGTAWIVGAGLVVLFNAAASKVSNG